MIKKAVYHLTDIRHYYGEKKILDIPQLKIEPGSITGIIGPNGSGKSTLLKLMGFIQKPSFGQILYNGRPELPFSPTIRSKVTLLTQKPYLLKRTVIENISYGLKIRRDTRNIEKRVKKALATVGLDNDSFAHRQWHELSGGEAQRVALAARLILKPDVLLLDEPIASVDTESAKLIREASIRARNSWGATLVIVSHDLQWLYSISDKQFSISKGNIFFTGIENILTGPFEHNDDKTLVKKIGDGQQIIVSKPSSQKMCTAIIRKKNIYLDLEKQPEQRMLNQLSGHINSMLLEKKKGYIMATVSIHDLSFVLRLIPDQISSLNLYPGKKVFLKFQSNDVEWI
jgi:tungstate transport system ATP-binding protein